MSASWVRESSDVADDPGDRDAYGDPLGVLAGLAVALRVTAYGVGDRLGVGEHLGRALDGRPPAAVDLADRHPWVAAQVGHLLRAAGRDPEGQTERGVDDDAHGHDVR